MKAHSISFRTDMVQAIFSEKKSVTRRIIGGKTPPYSPGDVLVVKEKYFLETQYDGRNPARVPKHSRVWYGNEGEKDAERGKPRRARYMCRWMSRLWLQVVSVRTEKLHNITEEDAEAEGVEKIFGVFARKTFRDLWNEIHMRDAPWSSNPDVCVIRFRRMSEDEIAAARKELATFALK
ncbi:MAG: hypothetical protein PHI12_09760 [Dehalococcoidales bacterium]|nr:hypothetical protein [Dehalococcoidales bacterium]